jgi:hypothetical protein
MKQYFIHIALIALIIIAFLVGGTDSSHARVQYGKNWISSFIPMYLYRDCELRIGTKGNSVKATLTWYNFNKEGKIHPIHENVRYFNGEDEPLIRIKHRDSDLFRLKIVPVGHFDETITRSKAIGVCTKKGRAVI